MNNSDLILYQAITQFAESIRTVFRSPRYQPTARDPVKHTEVLYVLNLVNEVESNILNKYLKDQSKGT